MPSAKMGKKSEEGNSGQTQPLLLGKICHDTNTRRMTQRGGKVCLGRNGIQNPSPSSGENYVRLMGGGWVGGGEIAFQGHSGQMENYLLPVIIFPQLSLA